MQAIRTATINARARTGQNIGTEVSKGLFRVVSVSFDARGKSTVTPLSNWVSPAKIVDQLNAV